MKVNTLTLTTPGYPEILKNIPDPPAKLFWIGAAPDEWLGRPRIAIVGSRKASSVTMLEITGHIRPTGAGHWAAT
jgi:predicted Rossmann fold nucleotide-binding protein DprA/Smf involved in DNA uptake